jgi:hypothetical protein
VNIYIRKRRSSSYREKFWIQVLTLEYSSRKENKARTELIFYRNILWQTRKPSKRISYFGFCEIGNFIGEIQASSILADCEELQRLLISSLKTAKSRD